MASVAEEGTSARVFAGATYTSGGKTGTAQAVTLKQNEKYKASNVDEYRRDHSLYEAFAPSEQPRVALALIVENAGWGTAAAAPIARRVLDYLLADIYPSEEDIAAVREGKATAPVGTPRKASEVPLPRGRDAFAMDTPASAPQAASGASVPASAVVAAPAASAPPAGASQARRTPAASPASPAASVSVSLPRASVFAPPSTAPRAQAPASAP